MLSCSASQRALLQRNCSTVAAETRTKVFPCPAFRCCKSIKLRALLVTALNVPQTVLLRPLCIAVPAPPQQDAVLVGRQQRAEGVTHSCWALSNGPFCAMNQSSPYSERVQQPGSTWNHKHKGRCCLERQAVCYELPIGAKSCWLPSQSQVITQSNDDFYFKGNN